MVEIGTILVCAGAGAVGGALLGLKGFLVNQKDGDKFDAWLFAKSLLLSAITGFSFGLFAPDVTFAFTAGFLGKSVQEVASAYGVKV